jgi:hypothetical protein
LVYETKKISFLSYLQVVGERKPKPISKKVNFKAKIFVTTQKRDSSLQEKSLPRLTPKDASLGNSHLRWRRIEIK